MSTLRAGTKLFCLVLLFSPLPQVMAQGGMSFGLTTTEYVVQHKDGTTESGSFIKLMRYYLAPDWSKPRRVLTNMGPGGDFTSSYATRSGQGRNENTNFTRDYPLQTGYLTNVAGGLNIDVLVLAKAEGERYSQLLVGRIGTNGVLNPEQEMGGMTGGYAGAMGGMGMGASMPGMGAGMPGGMGGAEGTMPGMTGGGGGMQMEADAEMGMSEAAPLKMVLLDEARYLPAGPRAFQLTPAQLKAVMELVSIDCSVEEELDYLRKARRDADADEFKKAEGNLKELLDKEYQLQLSKQRDDVARLADKLKALQEELARRASAQQRVVDVQLGQLVLEAQGLIGERP